jgi:hypothetical protein
MPEIEIKIKVNICSRCHHLWERRKGNNQPMVCPNCNSPYWNSMPKKIGRGKTRKEPLIFHGEEVLDSNFDEIPIL